MSIQAIVKMFEQVNFVLPGDTTEEEIFQFLRQVAEAAMLAAGSPSDHPLDDRIGRIVARRVWLGGHPEEPRPELSIEKEIEIALQDDGTGLQGAVK